MFSVVSGQLENSYFLEHFPVVYSGSVIFSKGRSSYVI